MSRKPLNLLCSRFGRLVAIRLASQTKNHLFVWECVCDCGNTVEVLGSDLKSLHTQSCGCLRKENTRRMRMIHGHSGTPVYWVWQHAIQRCHNPDSRWFKDYGGRGITVCKRWRDSFENFFADMGEPPAGKRTIDRINNEKGYSPENCRWATHKEQNVNRRNTKFVEFRGQRLPLVLWCEKVGLHYQTVVARLVRGWTVERALTVRP